MFYEDSPLEKVQLDETTLEDIGRAAQCAYRDVARYLGVTAEQARRMRVCFLASEFIVDQLAAKQYPVTLQSRYAQRAGAHTYAILRTEQANDVVIDPTWQQFVAENMLTAESPAVLVGTRTDVATVLREHGLAEDIIRGLWGEENWR